MLGLKMFHGQLRAKSFFQFSAAVGASILLTFAASTAHAFDIKKFFGLEEIDPAELVELHASYDLNRCSQEYPLLVTIMNGSDEKIEYTKFDVSGRVKNYSASIYHAYRLTTDRIIPAKESYTSCWRAPEPTLQGMQHPIETIIWTVKLDHVSFEDQ